MRLSRESTAARLAAAAWPVVVLAVGVVLIAKATASMSSEMERLALLVVIKLILVISIYVFSGMSGLFSFAHMGFAAVGAYCYALAATPPLRKSVLLPELPAFLENLHVSPFAALLLGAAVATVVAGIVSLPVMRLTGIAVAIATLAVLVVIVNVLGNWSAITGIGGTMAAVPMHVTLDGALVWACLVIAGAHLLGESSLGLKLRATRENEIAAAAMGVDVAKVRRVAFVLGGFVAAIGGILYGQYLGALTPDAFYVGLTVAIFVMLVVGGMNSLTGAVVGAVLVSLVVELLRRVEGGDVGVLSFAARPGLQEVGLALILLAVLVFRPTGVTGSREVQWPFGGRGGERPASRGDEPPGVVEGQIQESQVVR